jgi:uncharacterized protein (DUF433 family)
VFAKKKYVKTIVKNQGGQPRIIGTRITVGAILSYMAGGMSIEEILTDFPKLKSDHIYEALSFASKNFQDEVVSELSRFHTT